MIFILCNPQLITNFLMFISCVGFALREGCISLRGLWYKWIWGMFMSSSIPVERGIWAGVNVCLIYLETTFVQDYSVCEWLLSNGISSKLLLFIIISICLWDLQRETLRSNTLVLWCRSEPLTKWHAHLVKIFFLKCCHTKAQKKQTDGYRWGNSHQAQHDDRGQQSKRRE